MTNILLNRRVVFPNATLKTIENIIQLRYVANNAMTPNNFAAANKYLNSRKAHIARVDIVSPRLIIPNFYLPDAICVETGSGAEATVTAAIEIGGVCYQARFNGNVTGTVPDNSFLVSDPIVGLSIAKGAQFFSRYFGNYPAGIVYQSARNDLGATASNTSIGERLEFSATSLTDRTMTPGVFSPSGGTQIMGGVLGVIAESNAPAALIVGDSIGAGQRDPIGAELDRGIIARALGPNYGYMNTCVTGDTMTLFLASNTNRVALGAYVSDVIIEHGQNELGNSITLEQLQTNANAIRALYPGKKVRMTTTTPRTNNGTSSQIPHASESVRVAFNDWKRAGVSGFSAHMELTDIIETNSGGGTTTVRNGGWFKYPNYTGDGLHPGNASGNTGNQVFTDAAPSFANFLNT